MLRFDDAMSLTDRKARLGRRLPWAVGILSLLMIASVLEGLFHFGFVRETAAGSAFVVAAIWTAFILTVLRFGPRLNV